MKLTLKETAVLAIVVLASVIYALFMAREVRSVKAELREVVNTQRAQTELSRSTIDILDTLAQKKQTVVRVVEQAREEITNAEGTNEKVPPAVADAWAAGIDRLRGATEAGGTASDGGSATAGALRPNP